MRVVQVNCIIDELDREPAELLRAWPTLPLIAEAAAGAGVRVEVLQSARRETVFHRGEVTYRFVAEPRLRRGSGPGCMPWRLTEAIRRIAPDVVHFHGLRTPAHLWAACRAGVPVLVQDHGGVPGYWTRRFGRWSTSRARGGSFTAAEQAKEWGLPAHLPVFPIAESASLFTPGSRDAARAETGVFGQPALLWVGHLDANKDPLTVLRGIAAVLPKLPGLQLWLAFGSNALEGEIEDLLRAFPALRDHAHFLGAVPHRRVEALCRACDLFVLGSYRESCGFAVLEALACGLVPIVTDIPAFREITAGGAVGTLVAPGDAAGFAEAIATQSRRLGPATRERIVAHSEAHLSPAALGRRLARAYEAIAGVQRAKG